MGGAVQNRSASSVVSLLAATVAATVRCRCTILEVLEVVSLLARNLTVQYTSQKLDIVQVVEVVSLLAATVHTVCMHHTSQKYTLSIVQVVELVSLLAAT